MWAILDFVNLWSNKPERFLGKQNLTFLIWDDYHVLEIHTKYLNTFCVYLIISIVAQYH